ncbi:pyruvate decarboxylase [Alcaligenaceae bacterium]|nr:pyruvate decarboxylase [Alcaligenaceae bacterium]
MHTAGRTLVSLLELNGIDRVFCMPGESYLELLDALADSSIDTVTARHEGSAGFMALADGRLAGRPGVFTVSRGPGATNASIALHSAQQDGLPLILIIGQVPRNQLNRGSFQEIDYQQMFGGIAKWVAEVTDPERLPEVITRAITVAMQPTPGPVVISIPEDLLEIPMEPPRNLVPAFTHTTYAPDQNKITRILELLDRAERPLIIAGGEFSTDEDRQLLQRFAERHHVPVAVGFRRHGVFPNQHPLSAGDLGIGTTPEQLSQFEEADFIMALGTRLNDWTTLGYRFPSSPWPTQPFVHACADAGTIGKNIQPTIGMASYGPGVVRALLDVGAEGTAPSPGRRAWVEKLAGYAAARQVWKPQRFDDGVAFGNVLAALAGTLPETTSMVPDAGISAALVYRYFPFGGPRRLYSTISGVMGYGVPGAIAIAMREPHRTVVCLVGDGSFMMTGTEIAIAVERKLPVRIIVSNNRSLGTIRMHQEQQYPGRSHATDLPGPNFVQFAQAFGCQAFSIAKDEDILPAIEAAMKVDGPALIEVNASLASITQRAAGS